MYESIVCIVLYVQVHERSVDGDVLCLLARNLLEQNSQIRIILVRCFLIIRF